MTHELNELLARRADRARPPRQPEDVVRLIAARIEHRTRARRNRLAVVSGAAVVLAASAVGVAIADPGHGSSGPPSGPAGAGPHVRSAAATRGSTATPPPTPLPQHGTAAGTEPPALARLERRSAANRARQVYLQEQHRLHDELLHPTLVPVDPAPAGAEIAIGLVPEGFQYLSYDDADSYYGPSGLRPGDYFSKGIVVDVHLTAGGTGHYPLHVNGKPASYVHGQGYTSVRLRYNKRVDVGFQSPPSVHLSKKQALEIAASINVRGTGHKTKG